MSSRFTSQDRAPSPRSTDTITSGVCRCCALGREPLTLSDHCSVLSIYPQSLSIGFKRSTVAALAVFPLVVVPRFQSAPSANAGTGTVRRHENSHPLIRAKCYGLLRLTRRPT